jgi:hypothetical protein
MSSYPIADRKDEQIGLIGSVVALLFLFLLLIFFTYQVADPKPEPFQQPAQTELQELELENLKVDVGGGSEGSPSDEPVTEPRPETQQVLTKKNNPTTKTTTGKGTKTNSPNSQNDASNTKKSNNPFGPGGSGQNGTGSGQFGNDTGSGNGSGPGGVGDGAGRTRLNDPQVDNIVSDDNHRINLRLTINAEGNVVDVRNIASQTTTTDQRILNQVIAAVRKQVKYSKKSGATLEIVYLTVNLSAT